MAALSVDDSFAARLIAWQRTHGRHTLPWQRSRDPYRVWLSEIMLQQTQVATVIGYYERFLQRFPDVGSLAAATLDEVYALWSGLGYYSRARNLHACARAIVEQHGGRFPGSSAELQALPGIGRSTAAAIAAFCFDERVAILDGNVKRVLTRVLAFGDDLAVARHLERLWSAATALLPEAHVATYTQGLMDLGATVCRAKAPVCPVCPVRIDCRAAATQTQEQYPVKRRKPRRGTREHVWLWLQWRGCVWLVERPVTGVWAGLRSWPEFDDRAAFDAAVVHWPGQAQALPSFTHVLTHLDWTLHPVRWTLPEALPPAVLAGIERDLERYGHGGRWFTPAAALAAGLPAPLRKLLQGSVDAAEAPASPGAA